MGENIMQHLEIWMSAGENTLAKSSLRFELKVQYLWIQYIVHIR